MEKRRVVCNYAISSLLEEGKIYNVDLLINNFLLLEGFPYNYFNFKYFSFVD